MAAATKQKEYIVLFTHQKTKKRKTWQDGILKVSGLELKAELYDDQMKHLDSLFIRPSQVACGQELESDRYLITVEEERQATADISFQITNHSEKPHAAVKVSSNSQQPFQMCKRKRQGFKPPRFVGGSHSLQSDQTPLLQPLQKKQRVQGLEVIDESKTIKQKRLTREEFLHLYSQHGRSSDDMGFAKGPTLSNVEKYSVSRTTPQPLLPDQTVPCGSFSNAHESALHASSFSTMPCDNTGSPRPETVQNPPLLPSGKRNTSQMLALFCSKSRMPPVGILAEHNHGQPLQEKENCDSIDLSVTRGGDGCSKMKSSFKNNFESVFQTGMKQQVGNFDVRLKRQSEKQPGYSTGSDQEMNSVNEMEGSNDDQVSPILTPDSFITDQRQVEIPDDERTPTGEGRKQGLYCVSDRCILGKECSFPQSEDPLDMSVDIREGVEGNNKIGEQNSEIEGESQGPFSSEFTKVGETQMSFEADSETLSPFLGRNVPSRSNNTTLDDDRGNIEKIRNGFPFGDITQMGVENMALNGHLDKECDLDILRRLDRVSQPRNDNSFPYNRPGPHCGFKHHLVSTHPGSLFQYPALERAKSVGLSPELAASAAGMMFGLDEVNDIHGGTVYIGAQPGLSPEFFPPRTPGNFEPTQTELVTKVITSQDREVKGGEGHSWKGSVVSDTVKRDKPARNFHKNEDVLSERFYDCSETEGCWIDCIREEVRCADDVMAAHQLDTSESVACNSTQGRLGRVLGTDSDQLSQTVPCLGSTLTPNNSYNTEQAKSMGNDIQRRLHSNRTPLLTRPPGDEDDASYPNIHSSGPSLTTLSARSCDRYTFSPHTKSSPDAETSELPFGMLFSDNEQSQNVSQRRNAVAYEAIALSGSVNSSRNVHCNATDLFACSDDLAGEGPRGDSTESGRSSGSHVTNSVSRYHNLSEEMKETCSANDELLVLNAADDSMQSYSGPLCTKGEAQSSTKVSSCRRVGLSRVSKDTVDLRSSNVCAKQSHGGFHPPVSRIVGQASSVGQREMGGELFFPSAGECDGKATPARQVMIPTTFENLFHYRQVFKTALREHLNIILFELAQSYHSTLGKVDVSVYSAYEKGFAAEKPEQRGPSCPHGVARLRAVKKDGPNKGRLFYCCPATEQNQCKFFKWVDEYQGNRNKSRNPGQCTSIKPTLTTAGDITAFFRSHNVSLYCGCTLVRRQSERFERQTNFRRNSKSRYVAEQRLGEKKNLYLELSRRESSSTYSKETVHALLACNACTELTCIRNLEEHVKAQTMPLLPHIIHSKDKRLEPDVRRPSRGNAFIPPAQRTNVVGLGLPWESVEELADDLIEKHHLNEDQAAALKLCANMFTTKENTTTTFPVALIHGVFGAGKSFLLAVTILFLVKLFDLADSSDHTGCMSTQRPWKILISSTTNVAVDRILLGMLDLGYRDFVRVGSMRKIAKPVLPYSVHSTGSESQELRELQDILKGNLTTSEKTLVRRSIERHKLGENKRKLNQVRVVGVTCAACVFPCMDNLKFPVLLLDECSQMTEPASLIPLARFECQKLVLVGDPKQLSPTIQGSQPQHEAGLEQTMFDRLMKMGHDPIMLRTQYRCHPRISAIANRLFYENKLINGISEQARRPLTENLPTLCFYNVSKGKERAGSDGSYYNDEEAKFVVFLIECLLESGILPAQIGVITLYKSQLRRVSQSVSECSVCPQVELKAIQISTVDAFQGGEKDVIILSCVRTEHVGFIDCYRRTNVALTRAKRHLFIIGNLRMLSGNDVWGKVIQHCKEAPGGIVSSQEFVQKWTKKETSAVEGVHESNDCSTATDKTRGHGAKQHPGSQRSGIAFANDASISSRKGCENIQNDDAVTGYDDDGGNDDDGVNYDDNGDGGDEVDDDDDDEGNAVSDGDVGGRDVDGDNDNATHAGISTPKSLIDEGSLTSRSKANEAFATETSSAFKPQEQNEDSDEEELPTFDIMSLTDF